jgi:hypothetical protein
VREREGQRRLFLQIHGVKDLSFIPLFFMGQVFDPLMAFSKSSFSVFAFAFVFLFFFFFFFFFLFFFFFFFLFFFYFFFNSFSHIIFLLQKAINIIMAKILYKSKENEN